MFRSSLAVPQGQTVRGFDFVIFDTYRQPNERNTEPTAVLITLMYFIAQFRARRRYVYAVRSILLNYRGSTYACLEIRLTSDVCLQVGRRHLAQLSWNNSTGCDLPSEP